ncbi:C10 family peptidase [uncultured Draconibacterium sp.]|uniref:C10 family peptidase n=1 Tax=uncultured Draconibacterium sp. TaxID=1573823 RepID=UPI003217B733
MKTYFALLFTFAFSIVVFSQENGGPYTTDENTVLLMHFDGDATNSADVGNNGIVHGSGVSYETGVHGQALRLDNSTSDKQSWIEVPFYDELNLTDEFSIEFWFKPASKRDGNLQTLLWKEGKDGTQQYSAFVSSELNALEAFLDCDTLNNWDWSVNASTRLLDFEVDKWYHISFYYRYEGRHLLLLLRDANYKELYFTYGGSEAPPVTGDGKLSIGSGGWSCFDGWIDELRISNKKRNYRDDVLQDVDISSFKEEVFLQLKDSWGSYQWPLGELFPINKETGEIFRKNHCGPTAVSRAIHYWEFPRFPSGVLQHTMSNCDWYIDFDNTEYLWDLMPDNFPTDVTVEEYTPAATFAMHIGASSRESYDYMPCYPEFLINHFHYSPKTRILHREDYSHDEWINILKNELNNGRPVVAGGVIKETVTGQGAAGHYYVIDGYNKNNEFHTDYSMADNVWDDPDNFDYGYGMSIIAFMEPDWNNKTLEIITPTENSHLKSATETEIKWSATNVNEVMLEYSDDAGKTWNTITESTNANEAYNWTVPNLASKEYKIRISETEDLNVNRRTNVFEVYENKQFEFKNPGTNSVINGGMQQPVYWEATGIIAFKLEYSTDNGTTWLVIQDSANVNDNLSFIFPETETNEAKLRATDLENGELTYLSGNFSISTNSVKSFLYNNEEGTELLMHFENNLENAANNDMYAVEALTIGEYVDNYDLNLGKAFKNDCGPGSPMADFLWIYNSDKLNLGTNWTMETWVKINTIGDDKTGYYPVIIEKEDVCGILVDQNYFAQKNGFHAYLNFADGSNITFFQNQTLDFDKWYHVTLISDSASQTVNFFVHDENRNLMYENYQPFPEGSNGILKQNTNRLIIGGTGGPSNRYFDGYFDEVRVIKKSTLFDYLELAELPFSDDFEESNEDATFSQWTTQNLDGWHYWHIIAGQGVNNSQCMRFENCDIDQNDWLITKALDCSELSKLTINFDVQHNGNGQKPKLLYKILYGNGNASDWIELDYLLGETENEWNNTGNIIIEDLGDAIYFAFHTEFTANDGIYFLLDNFNVTGTITNTQIKLIPENDFTIYPNPVTSESVISFHTKTSEKVNLAVFDIQGRKISTLINGNLNAGTHTLPIGNQLKFTGIYFCKLSTSEGVSTLKIVKNK